MQPVGGIGKAHAVLPISCQRKTMQANHGKATGFGRPVV